MFNFMGIRMRERGKKAYDWLPNRNGIVVDLGCGNGEFTGYYAGKANFVVGCDIASDHLLQAQKVNPDISFVQCEGESLPLKDESVDALVFTDVLEHVDDERKTIQEIFRVMKEGAYMSLSVPHKGTFHFLDVENIKYYIGSVIKGKKESGIPHKHYTLTELNTLLADFELLGYSRSGCIVYPFCLIGNRVARKLEIAFIEKLVRICADVDYSIEYGRLGFNIMLLLKKDEA